MAGPMWPGLTPQQSAGLTATDEIQQALAHKRAMQRAMPPLARPATGRVTPNLPPPPQFQAAPGRPGMLPPWLMPGAAYNIAQQAPGLQMGPEAQAALAALAALLQSRQTSLPFAPTA